MALLAISWLIPAGIIVAGLMRRLDLFLALSLLVVLYDSLQAVGILLLARHGWRQQRGSAAAADPPITIAMAARTTTGRSWSWTCGPP